VTVTDTTVAEQLHKDGYRDSYTVSMGSSTPLVTFDVVGNSSSPSVLVGAGCRRVAGSALTAGHQAPWPSAPAIAGLAVAAFMRTA
jgi:hypothetical protein